jgi:CHASE2 domain-containing sensor protein
MNSLVGRTALPLLIVLVDVGASTAQQPLKPLSEPITGRETFLAVAIVVMMLCGLMSFLLAGRVRPRTHVALTMLAVLVGGFGLLVLFGSHFYESPIAAVAVVLLLVGLFKLMSQFETDRDAQRKKTNR